MSAASWIRTQSSAFIHWFRASLRYSIMNSPIILLWNDSISQFYVLILFQNNRTPWKVQNVTIKIIRINLNRSLILLKIMHEQRKILIQNWDMGRPNGAKELPAERRNATSDPNAVVVQEKYIVQHCSMTRFTVSNIIRRMKNNCANNEIETRVCKKN